MEVIIVAYAAVYLLTIGRSFQLLAKLPYQQFRMANLDVRLEASGHAGRRKAAASHM